MLKRNQSLQTFLKALTLLTKDEKKNASWILLMVIGLGCMEAMGVFSIMPFLTAISNPDAINTNKYFSFSYHYLQGFGVQNHKQFIVLIGLISTMLIVISTLYKCFSIYKMNSFIELKVHSIASRLLQNYLNQPYEYFVYKKRSEISTSILSQSNHVVDNAFRPGLTVISNSIVLVSVLLILVIVNPIVTFLSSLLIALVYMVIFKVFKTKISAYGARHLDNTQKRFQSIANIFNGIKEIKINKKFSFFSNLFSTSSKELSVVKSRIVTLNSVPHVLVEALIFSIIISISLFYILISSRMNDFSMEVIFPTLGLFGFAAIRLKPTFSYIYSGLVSLRYADASISSIIDELRIDVSQTAKAGSLLPVIQSSFTDCITFENLCYRHQGSKENTLKGLSFSLGQGKCLGIAGSTGAGKSTLVDIMSGLLRPSSGSVFFDGQAVDLFQNARWQDRIGYVPQDIFMLDATIAENIAFGCSLHDLDLEKVYECAKAVLMDDFISNELPLGYQTMIGERGSKLSGGQRQRLGIARALYNDPEILIFDEATSALDGITETQLIDSIKLCFPNKTMIFITHKKNLFRVCDKIIILEKGSIVTDETYDSLIKADNPYREFVADKLS
jgi:ABC-type multidrug transport system fused ATPase/permease subunit